MTSTNNSSTRAPAGVPIVAIVDGADYQVGQRVIDSIRTRYGLDDTIGSIFSKLQDYTEKVVCDATRFDAASWARKHTKSMLGLYIAKNLEHRLEVFGQVDKQYPAKNKVDLRSMKRFLNELPNDAKAWWNNNKRQHVDKMAADAGAGKRWVLFWDVYGVADPLVVEQWLYDNGWPSLYDEVKFDKESQEAVMFTGLRLSNGRKAGLVDFSEFGDD